MWKKLKVKWGLKNDFQVLLIMLVFALTGSTVLAIKGWFFQIIGLDAASSSVVKVVLYLLFIFPAYQVLLLAYGFLLGQFSFFWKKEKLLAIRVISLFKK